MYENIYQNRYNQYPTGIQQPVPYEYPGTTTPPNYQYPVTSTGLPDNKY